MSQGPVIDINQLMQFWRSVAEVAGRVAPDSDLELVDRLGELLPHLQDVLADKTVLSADIVSALDLRLTDLGLALAPLLRIRLLFAQGWLLLRPWPVSP